jgi:hypothetical protein
MEKKQKRPAWTSRAQMKAQTCWNKNIQAQKAQSIVKMTNIDFKSTKNTTRMLEYHLKNTQKTKGIE